MLRSDFDSLRSRYEIMEYALKHFVVYKDGMNRGRIVCPFHGDTDPSLVIYPNTQSWHCFGCGKAGDIFDLMGAVEGKSLGEIFSDHSTGEADYAYWKEQLGRRTPLLDRDEWFVIGCIALRGLHDDEHWDRLAKDLDDATLEAESDLQSVVLGLISKANSKTTV